MFAEQLNSCGTTRLTCKAIEALMNDKLFSKSQIHFAYCLGFGDHPLLTILLFKQNKNLTENMGRSIWSDTDYIVNLSCLVYTFAHI